MFKTSLEELSECLDEHIVKALKPKKVSKIQKAEEEISKALSHNPFMPHEMNNDSPYYNPYQLSTDGFLPYPVEYWESQGKERHNYLTTIQLYESMKPVNKSIRKLRDLSKSLGIDLVKGGAVPIGTIHTYRDGQRYQKVAEGKWTPMAGIEKETMRNHLQHKDPQKSKEANRHLENHASKVQAIKEVIDRKTKEEGFKHATTQEAVAQTMGHVKNILSKLFDGPMPKDLEDHISNAIQGKGKLEPEPKPEEPAAKVEQMEAQDKQKMESVDRNLQGGGIPHKVKIGFTYNGKKFEHEFPKVVAHTPSHAQEKIETELKNKLGNSVQIHRFRAEKVGSQPEAQV